MDCVVQWATILSPIIAVVMARWTIRSSAKDTAKKLAALEESTHEQIAALDKSTKEQIAALELSTKKQIESIKKLTKIQLEVSAMQIDMDLNETYLNHKQLTQRKWDESLREMHFSQYNVFTDSMSQREDRKRDMSDREESYTNHFKELSHIRENIETLKKQLGGE